jgi:hypothetical protein
MLLPGSIVTQEEANSMRETRRLVLGVFCAFLAAAGPTAAEEPKQAPRSRPRANLDWVSLETGLERLREKYQPALILFEPSREPLRADAAPAPDAAPGGPSDPAPGGPSDPAPAAPGFLDEHLTDTTLRDVCRRFVLIRIGSADLEKPYPEPGRAAAPGAGKGEKGARPEKGKDKKKEDPGEPPPPAGDPAAAAGKDKEKPPALGTRLEVTDGKPVLIAFSFREEVIKRYEELPTRTQLKKELSRITKVSELHAREARRIEPELDGSLYAFRLGKTRDAVLKVVPFETKESRQLVDQKLGKRIDEVIAEYRAKAGEALAAADELEAKKKYEEAIKAYDDVGRDFPFPDILKEANKRKSVTLRKLTVGY